MALRIMGGAYNHYGTVFKLSPSASGWTETTLYSFTGNVDGFYPNTAVTLHGGWLYGATSNGGGSVTSGGVVYRVKP